MRNYFALIFLSCASFLSCAVEVTHQCADECLTPVAACEVVAYGVHAVCDLEESYTPFETQCTPDNIGQSFTQSVDIGRGQTCFLHTYQECADGTRTDVVIDSIGSLVPILIPDAPERLLAYLPGESSVMHVDSNSNVGGFNGFIGTTIDLDAAGNNRLVVVNTGMEFTGATGDVPATVEINGVSIIANLIASSIGAAFRVEWAYYAFEADLPATAGTYDVDVTFTGATHTNKEVEAISVDYYTGIDQAGLVDFGEDWASSKVGSGGASITPDSTDYLIVGSVLTGGTAAHTWTSSAGTPVKTEEAFNTEGGISTAHVFGTDDTSDQDLSWTVSPTVRYGMVVGIFNVASGGGAVSLSPDGLSTSSSLGLSSVTQHHSLASDDLLSAQALGASSVVDHQSLTVASLLSAQLIAGSSLLQHHVLPSDSLTTSQLLGVANLIQNQLLAVNGIDTAQQISNADNVQHHVLLANDLDSAQALSIAAVVQHHLLSSNPLLTAQEVESSAASINPVLSSDDLLSAQLIQVAELIQHSVIVANTLAQSSLLSAPSLDANYQLASADLVQAQLLGVPSLDIAFVLTTDSLSQSSQLENVALFIAGSLAVQNLVQSSGLGSPGLTQHQVLSADNISQATLLEVGDLTRRYSLSVQNILQSQQIGSTSLSLSDALAVADISQLQAIDSPLLDQHHVLAVQDLSQSQLLDIVSFGGSVIGLVDGKIVVYVSEERALAVHVSEPREIIIH